MTPYMHLYILASGSKGNAAVVEGPKGSVLVDCGLSRRELHRRAELVDCDLSRVCAVLVTHEHGDHTSGLSVIANHFDGPFYATEGTATARKHLQRLPFTCVSHDCKLELGGMSIQAFPTSHDVTESVGYRVTGPDGVFALATDTGCVTDEMRAALLGADTVLLESNHDEEMLRCGPYPIYLKRRILSDRGHLSNAACASFARELAGSGTRQIILGHLSRQNNTPAVARRTVAAALEGTEVRLLCAPEFGCMEVAVEEKTCSR